MDFRVSLEQLIEKLSSQIHTIDGRPLNDVPEHLRFCSACRWRADMISEIAALLAAGGVEPQEVSALVRSVRDTAEARMREQGGEDEVVCNECYMAGFVDGCNDVLERLGAGAVPPREDHWQPIESAPKGYDGKRFQYVLFWGVSSGRSFDHPVIVCGYMDHDRTPVQFYSYKLRITHWMPLPSPPIPQEESR